ncbi:MAG: TetR/AcrR family transcriptional regulator C-terminal domain-containing protein, partial [Paracoccaceae bacterium]
ELQIDDIELAAHQFSELCKVELFPKRVFGVRDHFDQAEIDRIAESTVAMFLARYGVKNT